MSFTCDREIKAARKPKRCWYCGCRIPVGSPYCRRTFVNEGEFGVMNFHKACEEFAIDVLNYVDDWQYDNHDAGEFCAEMAEHAARKLTVIEGGGKP